MSEADLGRMVPSSLTGGLVVSEDSGTPYVFHFIRTQKGQNLSHIMVFRDQNEAEAFVNHCKEDEGHAPDCPSGKKVHGMNVRCIEDGDVFEALAPPWNKIGGPVMIFFSRFENTVRFESYVGREVHPPDFKIERLCSFYVCEFRKKAYERGEIRAKWIDKKRFFFHKTANMVDPVQITHCPSCKKRLD